MSCVIMNIDHIGFNRSPLISLSRSRALSCMVKVKIGPSSDGQTFGHNPPQSSLPVQPPLERAYKKVALWLLNLVLSPFTNGRPDRESRFRPGREVAL